LQFTTLENTPPEYLFLGSYARESYSADTFCLGLSYLHLLAGEEPYEEHLRDVTCPPLLLGKLKKLWRTSNNTSQFRVIAEVIESLDPDGADSTVNVLNVLYDTFYRYLVMFDLDLSSLSAAADDSTGDLDCPYPPSNAVLCAVIDCLGLDSSSTRRLTKLQHECIQQFTRDRAEWSLQHGASAVMQRVRHQASLLGDSALELLSQMVNLDASKRCSLHEAITSSLFAPMRVPADSESAPAQGPSSAVAARAGAGACSGVRAGVGRSFMHYKGKQFLPIF
jgi:serine/threonine protein kinase